MRAISFNSGELLWAFNSPLTHSYSRDMDGSPLYQDGVLHVAAENGEYYALDTSDLVSRQSNDLGPYREPRVVRTTRLYSLEDGERHAGSRGRAALQADRPLPLGSSNLVIEASPAMVGDQIFVAAGSGHVFGLDRHSGTVNWDFRIGSDLDGTPAVTDDGKLLVAVEKQYIPGPGGVFMLDPAKPARDAAQWYFPLPSTSLGSWQGGVIGSVSINDRTAAPGEPRLAAFIGVDGGLHVVARDELDAGRTVVGPDGETELPTPREVFSSQVGPSISTPLFIENRIIVGGYNEKLIVFEVDMRQADVADNDTVTGRDGRPYRITVRKAAEAKLGAGIESTPLVWKGKIIVGCRDGFIYVLGDAANLPSS
jgi:outer membrane protein assembly factor BamB